MLSKIFKGGSRFLVKISYQRKKLPRLVKKYGGGGERNHPLLNVCYLMTLITAIKTFLILTISSGLLLYSFKNQNTSPSSLLSPGNCDYPNVVQPPQSQELTKVDDHGIIRVLFFGKKRASQKKNVQPGLL